MAPTSGGSARARRCSVGDAPRPGRSGAQASRCPASSPRLLASGCRSRSRRTANLRGPGASAAGLASARQDRAVQDVAVGDVDLGGDTGVLVRVRERAVHELTGHQRFARLQLSGPGVERRLSLLISRDVEHQVAARHALADERGGDRSQLAIVLVPRTRIRPGLEGAKGRNGAAGTRAHSCTLGQHSSAGKRFVRQLLTRTCTRTSRQSAGRAAKRPYPPTTTSPREVVGTRVRSVPGICQPTLRHRPFGRSPSRTGRPLASPSRS